MPSKRAVGASYHGLRPPNVGNGMIAWTVEAEEEARRDVAEQAIAVGGEPRTQPVKHLPRRTARIIVGLEHDRRGVVGGYEGHGLALFTLAPR